MRCMVLKVYMSVMAVFFRCLGRKSYAFGYGVSSHESRLYKYEHMKRGGGLFKSLSNTEPGFQQKVLFSLLYREGNDHVRPLLVHTGPVKGANRNRLLDNGKGTRYLRNNVQVPFGQTIIDGPQGIDGTPAAIPKREATTVYQSIVRHIRRLHLFLISGEVHNLESSATLYQQGFSQMVRKTHVKGGVAIPTEVTGVTKKFRVPYLLL